jgi:CobQ-like glutamine amidotransferase family enzyme
VREEGPRLIGNIAIRVRLPEPGLVGGDGVLAGFENHGGRTSLLEGQEPLGEVLAGHGNDGRSGSEGAVRGGVVGTYIHGPLLPKNVWFADWLIARATGIPPADLAQLDDALERAAHADALLAAGL